MCLPSAMRIMFSIASLKKWIVIKGEFKASFLQTGQALSDVFFIPTREYYDKDVYWLLLTVVYSLVNANFKWKSLFDHFFFIWAYSVTPCFFYII